MTFWYTYQLQCEQFAKEPDKIAIASDCRGSAIKKRCNFDEFITWIKGEKNTIVFKTDLADKWNVDFNKGVASVIQLGYGDKYAGTRLLPKVYGEGMPLYRRPPKYTKMMSEITKSVRDIKAAKNLDASNPALMNIHSAASGIINARTIDIEGYIFDDLTKALNAYGSDVVIDDKPIWKREGVPDRQYLKVNFERTMEEVVKVVNEQAAANNEGDPPAQKTIATLRKTLKKFKDNYTRAFQRGREHRRIFKLQRNCSGLWQSHVHRAG
ncbi:hypothetical protein FE257_005831 [Aspergillus nanangensis]|uniref:Uncharacterized protein n=1 Tax=Aspergillus nanangensis TaxID=2582783 RepID=A0AAD4GV57_ASPNN|nr:hypothetical protein FE257_005831 [Aspergillus nanangensis]